MPQDYIKNLRAEYEDATTQLTQAREPETIKKLSRRHAEVEKILKTDEELQNAQSELTENRKLVGGEDAELAALAAEEVARLEIQIPKLEQQLKKMLLPKSPEDAGDAILEIRAGTGGDEAALFASELVRMYTRFAERRSWRINVESISRSDLGGIKEAILHIVGPGAYGVLKYEGGVHRVQRVPETEKSGRVHTSTASVAVLPLLPEEEFDLDPKDIKFEATTSSGAGGQSVNTAYSAVRLVHLPTGIASQSQDERSQHQNKEKAMRVLRARVAAHYAEEREREIRSARSSQIKGAERSDKIRTYNFPQDRITDHRLNQNFHQMEVRLDGDIEEIINTLKDLDEQEQLAELEERKT